jgi:hypothetical protein
VGGGGGEVCGATTRRKGTTAKEQLLDETGLRVAEGVDKHWGWEGACGKTGMLRWWGVGAGSDGSEAAIHFVNKARW